MGCQICFFGLFVESLKEQKRMIFDKYYINYKSLFLNINMNT